MVDQYNKRWPIIHDLLKREGIAKQHLNSFDEFLENGLQQIITEVNQIDIENAEYPYKIQLEKIKLQQPRMMELDGSITHVTPAEARLRNISYVAPIMMEVSVIEPSSSIILGCCNFIFSSWILYGYSAFSISIWFTSLIICCNPFSRNSSKEFKCCLAIPSLFRMS